MVEEVNVQTYWLCHEGFRYTNLQPGLNKNRSTRIILIVFIKIKNIELDISLRTQCDVFGSIASKIILIISEYD